MVLALILSGGAALLLGWVLLFSINSSPKTIVSSKLHNVFGDNTQNLQSKKQAFQNTSSKNSRQLLWLHIRDRVQGVGGIRVLLPIFIAALFSGTITLYFTTQYAPMTSFSLGALVTVGVAVSGYKYKLNQLRKQFNESLPLAIDLVVRAVSAGVALPASFEHVSESIAGSVGTEFRVMHDSIKIGMPIRSALEQAVRRIPSAEFNYFAIILSLNIETGGKLSESLGNLSEKLRSRRHMERKVQALTSEPRMSAIIVSFFPPVFLGLLYLLNKQQFFFLFTDSTGKTLLGYAAASILIGMLQIYRMTKVSA